MLQLKNSTPYASDRAVLLDLDGSEIWVVVAKATFDIQEGQTVVASKQDPVRLVDEYFGEPGVSSLKYECELVFKKPGTDVVVNGHARAPLGRPVSKLDVGVSVASKRKVIRVYGDRHWKNSGTGLSITSPEPFLSMPLTYERAFGGTDTAAEDPADHGAEYRNPIGVGFATSSARLSGRPLPNLEDPADEIKVWNSRPTPVGVGLIGRHWEPRRRFVGTCDAAYLETRLPLYPVDFDLRYFQGAPPDMIFSPHLRGGEPVELYGMTAEGRLAFALPRVALGFRTLLDGRWVDHRATLGSVVIEPDVPRVMLTWQTFLPCHRKTFDLEQTVVFQKDLV